MTNEDTFFEKFKSHRQSQNIEIPEICEYTKISPRYIEAIESGDFTILPTVYMRLFLKAYAKFIGLDPVKTLEEYELFTTGTINNSLNTELNKTTSPNTKNNIEKDVSAQITPQNIFSGVGAVLGIIILLYWAGQITSEQNTELENIPNSLKDTTPKVDSKNSNNNVSTNIKTIDEPNAIIYSQGKDIPINNQLLNSNDFLLKNQNRESTNIIKLTAPYSIYITILEETKLNVTKSDTEKITQLVNKIASAGEEFEFAFKSTINFEFWNNKQIKVRLNNIPLDNYLSNDGLSIRGSYEAELSQLYLGFYKNTTF